MSNIENMRHVIILFIFIAAISCTRAGRVEKEGVVNQTVPYKLLGSLYSSRITLTPTNDYATGSIEEEDRRFAKMLLSALDSSLVDFEYEVNIDQQVILARSMDTLNIVVYDFLSSQSKPLLKRTFMKKEHIENSVNVYKMPTSCRFVLNNGNLCSICIRGLNARDIVDDPLIHWVKNTTAQRLVVHAE